MGYDAKTIQLTFTDRSIIRAALEQQLINGQHAYTSEGIRHVLSKMRWADHEQRDGQV